MKNKFVLICAVLCSLQMMALPSLVVRPLKGQECVTALSCVGKLVYVNDSLHVYDATKTLVFADLLTNVQHVRFSDEKPNDPTHVENAQNNNALQIKVYPNPTQEVLHVENAPSGLLRLYSISGNLLQTISTQEGNVQINMANLPTGNYLLICGKENIQIIKQ